MMISDALRKQFGIVGNAWKEKRGKTQYYRVKTESGKRYLHSLVCESKYGKPKDGEMVDHLDGDGLNVAEDNLRYVSKSGNAKNQSKNANNTSGHVGIYWSKRSHRWIANGKKNKKTIYLGSFVMIEDAIEARAEWEQQQGGFTERHGT